MKLLQDLLKINTTENYKQKMYEKSILKENLKNWKVGAYKL